LGAVSFKYGRRSVAETGIPEQAHRQLVWGFTKPDLYRKYWTGNLELVYDRREGEHTFERLEKQFSGLPRL